MAIRTVGAAGDFPFSQAGIVSAIAACSADDTVRIIDRGTITLTSELSIGTRITLEGDPALVDLYDLTTMPKLYTSSSIRAMDLDVAAISVKNLQFEGFPIDSTSAAGGTINGYRGGAGDVGTFENLLFVNCNTCIQECTDGTQRNIHAINCARLVRDCYALNMAKFSIVQTSGYNYVIDAQWDKWSIYRLGAIYQPYYNANDRAVRVLADAGFPGLIENVSVYRVGAGSDGIAFTGEAAYCTVYGYQAIVGGGGIDNGNNFSRDPLFTDAAAGDFTWQEESEEYSSGVAITGITTDAVGVELPTGFGWPRGPYGYAVSSPWSEFGTDAYAKVSGDFTINRNLNISGHWQKRSGLSEGQNGANAVEQISFGLTVPGPSSLRGRNKPYTTTANPTAPNTPGPQGF